MGVEFQFEMMEKILEPDGDNSCCSVFFYVTVSQVRPQRSKGKAQENNVDHTHRSQKQEVLCNMQGHMARD